MIENYTDLQDQVVAFVANPKVREAVTTCIQLAEDRIKNDLLLRRIERAHHGHFDGPVIFLPEDCEAIQRLMYYRGREEFSVPYSDPKSVERYTGSVGAPIAYTMMDQAIILYPTPAESLEYTLYYVPTVRSLSGDSPRNWLLERSSNVYLHASCLEGALYLHDLELAGTFEGRYKQALDALQQASERQRMPSLTAMTARPFRALRAGRV